MQFWDKLDRYDSMENQGTWTIEAHRDIQPVYSAYYGTPTKFVEGPVTYTARNNEADLEVQVHNIKHFKDQPGPGFCVFEGRLINYNWPAQADRDITVLIYKDGYWKEIPKFHPAYWSENQSMPTNNKKCKRKINGLG